MITLNHNYYSRLGGEIQMIKVIEGITIKFEFENKTLYLPQELKEEISNFWIQSKKMTLISLMEN